MRSADNPPWTKADFAAARPAEELPLRVLAAFPATVDRLIEEGRVSPIAGALLRQGRYAVRSDL